MIVLIHVSGVEAKIIKNDWRRTYPVTHVARAGLFMREAFTPIRRGIICSTRYSRNKKIVSVLLTGMKPEAGRKIHSFDLNGSWGIPKLFQIGLSL
jgi:hypothetical protein